MVLGILAHVDAGKTTLSEAILYVSGKIRKLGRVDNKDAFLDNYALERQRGITIFSKQARVSMDGFTLTLLDTPGHVDFSAEMERTLQVLDLAILVISGADGVQGHTRTLWKLLKQYKIPTFLFINKMDQPGTCREAILKELTSQLEMGCIDFGERGTENFYENLAVCEEGLLNQYLESGRIENGTIKSAIAERKVFPCFFGSALKLKGVEEFLEGLKTFACTPVYSDEFGARVFKITRDEQGNRLTHMKITGGSLKARTLLSGGKEFLWEEKVNQIRLYSGEKFEPIQEVKAGDICAVTGLSRTIPGEGLGREKDAPLPFLEPVLSYCIRLPKGCEAAVILPKLKQLEEEDPMLQIIWKEEVQEIHAKVMGEVQIEILQCVIAERFGVEVKFDAGHIVYKETIANIVEGVGHFEPLRHYAEVHLLMKPTEAGSGLQFKAEVSEDILAKNWQRLILTHLEEKEHCGVLTGSAITDMEITLVSGRAHLKHTEGGDFRQATYRALRQGLMEAETILLEPIYEFRLEVPQESIGRAMTDLEKRHGAFSLEQREDGTAILTGTAPVITMQDYQKEVIAYTRGCGRLFCTLKGYAPCHNMEEVVIQTGYDPERDLENPTGSVFCAHGAGYVVPWDQVKEYMHLPSCFLGNDDLEIGEIINSTKSSGGSVDKNGEERWIGSEEIDAILNRACYANSKESSNRKKEGWKRERREGTLANAAGPSPVTRVYKGQEKKEMYLLVDGYNIIFAWEDLKELAEINLDSARGKLMDILCNYQGMKRCELIVVFDAYRVQGHQTEATDYHNIHVVYTKEAETADQYIEKFAHDNGRKYDVTVATSDGLEQIIIRGQGCRLLSARDLQEDIRSMRRQLQEDFLDKQVSQKRYLMDEISEDVEEIIRGMQ